MRQLRETRQHWRDRKRTALPEYADVRAEHRNIIALLEAGDDIQGERQLSGAWKKGFAPAHEVPTRERAKRYFGHEIGHFKTK